MGTFVSLSGLDLSFLKSPSPQVPPCHPVASAQRVEQPPADSLRNTIAPADEDWRGDDPWRLRVSDTGARYWENTVTGEIDCPRSSYVRGDITPYKSMVTGEMITSRSEHREHLRKHDCIEVGNEIPKVKSKETIARERKKQLHETLKREVQDWHQGKRPAPVEAQPVEISKPLENGTVLRDVKVAND